MIQCSFHLLQLTLLFWGQGSLSTKKWCVLLWQRMKWHWGGGRGGGDGFSKADRWSVDMAAEIVLIISTFSYSQRWFKIKNLLSGVRLGLGISSRTHQYDILSHIPADGAAFILNQWYITLGAFNNGWNWRMESTWQTGILSASC